MSTHNAPGFVSGLKAFFNNALYSDLTIICGGEKFYCHKMLLHEQSPVFRRMLSGGFAETGKEFITIKDDDPKIFGHFLKFLYSGRYPDDLPSPTSAVKLYSIADKYDFDPLRKVATRKLDEACDPADNPDAFIDACYAVDSNTAPGDLSLWNIVIPQIKCNISALTDSPRFMKMATIDIPDLATVLFKSMDKSSTSVVFRSNPIALPSRPTAAVDVEYEQTSEADGGEETYEMYEARERQRKSQGRFGPGRRLGDA